jgi:hypothetical protein
MQGILERNVISGFSLVNIFIHLFNPNKLPQTGWLLNSTISLLAIVEAEKSVIKALPDSTHGEGCFLPHRPVLSLEPPRAKGGREPSERPYNALISITSHMSYHLISHLGE